MSRSVDGGIRLTGAVRSAPIARGASVPRAADAAAGPHHATIGLTRYPCLPLPPIVAPVALRPSSYGISGVHPPLGLTRHPFSRSSSAVRHRRPWCGAAMAYFPIR